MLRSHYFTHGNITEVHIAPGTYDSTTAGASSAGRRLQAGSGQLTATLLRLDENMFANRELSDLYFIGDNSQGPVIFDASLVPAGSHLFEIYDGLPGQQGPYHKGQTTFSGLTFQGFTEYVFFINGSSVTFDECIFVDNPGGALHITAEFTEIITVKSSNFTRNGACQTDAAFRSTLLADGAITPPQYRPGRCASAQAFIKFPGRNTSLPTSTPMHGGAIKFLAGTLVIYDTPFMYNKADKGGAIYSAGQTTTTIYGVGSNFTFNDADAGGALYATGASSTALKNGTVMTSFNLAWLGKSAYIAEGGGANAAYSLPAPMAHWIAALECRIYRVPCTTATCVPEDQPPLPVQPCEEHEYGQWVGRTNPGAVEDGLPFRCAPGKLGSTLDAADQSTSRCTDDCPAGHYCPAASQFPTPCRQGTYCPTASGAETPCAGGTYGSRPLLTSQEECTVCPSGWWCSSGNKIACGYNTFNPDMQQEAVGSCFPCPDYSATRKTNTTFQDDCICNTGFVVMPLNPLDPSARPNFTCQCDLGMGFIQGSGEDRCEKCEQGFYKDNVNNIPCTGCPVANMITFERGATSDLDCECRAGYYLWDCINKTDSECLGKIAAGIPTRTCEACPDGANCTLQGQRLETLNVMKNWFRQTPSSRSIRPCLTPDVCQGGGDVETQCVTGQTGPFCTVCDVGYHGGNPKLGIPCEECYGDPTLTMGLMGGVLGTTLVAAIFLFATGKWRIVLNFLMSLNLNFRVQRGAKKVKLAVNKKKNMKKAGPIARCANWSINTLMGIMLTIKKQQVKGKILVSLMQVMNGIGATFEITYPASIAPLTGVSDYLELDVATTMPLQCIFPWINFTHKLMIRTAYPWVLIFVFQLGSRALRKGAKDDEEVLVEKKVARLRQKEIDEGVKDPWEQVDGFRRVGDLFDDLSFFLLFLLYPGCSAALFSFFVCYVFDGPGESGAQYLQVDLSIECGGSKWLAVFPYVMVMIGMYPIGTPCIFYSILFSNRDLLEEMKRTELLAASSKANIKAMEQFVLAHDGQQTLKDFKARQDKIADQAVKRFAKLNTKLASAAENGGVEGPLTPGGSKNPNAGQKVPGIRHVSANASGKDVDEVIKNSILKLQALTRGKIVRKKTSSDKVAFDAAKLENDKLFAKEYGTIGHEIENVANLKRRTEALTEQMPSTVQKLVAGYELRCYWFEIFECWRKLALTCLPQLLPSGSIDQLVAGLLISFTTFAMYVAFSPYDDDDNDQLSIVCQSILFFSLLSGIVNHCGATSDFINLLLPLMILVPLSYLLVVKSGLQFYWNKYKKKREEKMKIYYKRHPEKTRGQPMGMVMVNMVDRALGTPMARFAMGKSSLPGAREGPAPSARSKATTPRPATFDPEPAKPVEETVVKRTTTMDLTGGNAHVEAESEEEVKMDIPVTPAPVTPAPTKLTRQRTSPALAPVPATPVQVPDDAVDPVRRRRLIIASANPDGEDDVIIMGFDDVDPAPTLEQGPEAIGEVAPHDLPPPEGSPDPETSSPLIAMTGKLRDFLFGDIPPPKPDDESDDDDDELAGPPPVSPESRASSPASRASASPLGRTSTLSPDRMSAADGRSYTGDRMSIANRQTTTGGSRKSVTETVTMVV